MAAPTKFVSPSAEVVSKAQCLAVNVAASRGLQQVLKTNLGTMRTRNGSMNKGWKEICVRGGVVVCCCLCVGFCGKVGLLLLGCVGSVRMPGN